PSCFFSAVSGGVRGRGRIAHPSLADGQSQARKAETWTFEALNRELWSAPGQSKRGEGALLRLSEEMVDVREVAEVRERSASRDFLGGLEKSRPCGARQRSSDADSPDAQGGRFRHGDEGRVD